MSKLYYTIYVIIVVIITIIVIILTQKYNTKSSLILEKEKEIEKTINERTVLFDNFITRQNNKSYEKKILENYNTTKDLFIELKNDKNTSSLFDDEIKLLQKIISYCHGKKNNTSTSSRKRLNKEIESFSTKFCELFSNGTLHSELTKDNITKFYKTILDKIDIHIELEKNNEHDEDDKYITDNKLHCKFISKLISQY